MPIFDDPKFHALSRDEQKRTLTGLSKKFAAMKPEDQDAFLASVPAGYSRPENRLASAAVSGIQSSMGHVEDVAANTAMLLGADGLEGHLRGRSERMRRLASGGEPQTVGEKVAYAAGSVPLSVLGAAPAAMVGGPIAGLAAYEALGAADKGPKEIAKAAATGAALGGILKVGEPFSRPVRAAIVGGGTGALELGMGADPVDAGISAGTMAVLSMLGGKAHPEVRRQLDVRAEETRPVVAEEPPRPAPPGEPPPAPPPTPVPEPPVRPAPAPEPPAPTPAAPTPPIEPPRPPAVPEPTPPPEKPVGRPIPTEPPQDIEVATALGELMAKRRGMVLAGRSAPSVSPSDVATQLGITLKEATARLEALEQSGHAQGVLPSPKHKVKVYSLRGWEAPKVEAPAVPTEEVPPASRPAEPDPWGFPPEHVYSDTPWSERAEALASRMPEAERADYAETRAYFERLSDKKLARARERKAPNQAIEAAREAEVERRAFEQTETAEARATVESREAGELESEPVSAATARAILEQQAAEEIPGRRARRRKPRNEGAERAEEPTSTERARAGSRKLEELTDAEPAETGIDRGPPGRLYHRFMQAEMPFGPLRPDEPLPKARQLASPMAKLAKVIKALGATVQQGTLRNLNREKGVGGYARTNLYAGKRGRAKATRTIRVRKWGDFQATIHELMHYIDSVWPEFADWYDPRFTVGGPNVRPWTRAQEQMLELSYDVSLPHEGGAEFLRMWLTKRSYLEKNADAALREFEAKAPEILGKQVWKLLNEARVETESYFEQGAGAALKSVIGKPNIDVGQLLDGAATRLRYEMLDDLAGISEAEIRINGAVAPDGPAARFKLLRQLHDLREIMWDRGAPVLDAATERVTHVGEGLKKILTDVTKGKTENETHAEALEHFQLYGVARMAREMRAQGRENLVTPEMERAGLAYERPAFKVGFEKLIKFNERVADFGEASGLFNATQRAEWGRSQYAWGLFRILDASRSKGRGIDDPLTQASGVHHLRGSSRNLREPIDAMLYGPMRIMQLSLENLAKKSLYYEVIAKPGGGRLGELLGLNRIPQYTSRDATLAGIRRALVEQVGEQAAQKWFPMLNAMSNEMANFVTTFVQSPPRGGHIMEFREGGITKYVQITDDLLAASIQNMRRETIPYWQKLLLDAPRKLIHAAVTLDPSFMLAQLVRDPMMATITTRTGMQALTSSARGYIEAIKKSDVYYDAMAQRVGVGTRSSNTPAKALGREVVRAAQRESGDLRGYVSLMNPLNLKHYLEAFGRIIEAGPRVGEYMRSQKMGESPIASGFRGREATTDFSNQGASNLAVTLSHAIPFYRAMMASADRMYRAGFRDPTFKARTAARVALFTASSLAYHVWASEQDWYKNVAPWVHWNSIVLPPVKVGDEVIQGRVPMIYEVGMLANVTKRAYDEAMANPEDRSQYLMWKDVGKILQVNFGLGMPWMLEAYTEAESNRISHTGAPIEPIGEQRLLPFYRTGPGVPLALERAARLQLGVVPSEAQVSPAKANAFLRGLFGNWHKAGFMLADASLYPGQSPSKHIDDLPFASRFLMRPGKYSRASEDFYRMMTELEQASATHREAFKRNDEEMAGALEDIPYTSGGRLASRLTRAVASMRSEIEAVERAKDLTPEQKRMQVDIIRQELDLMMRTGTEEARDMIRDLTREMK